MRLFDRFEIKRIQKPPVEVPSQLAADLRTQQGKKDIVKTMLTSGSVFDKNRLSRIMADALSTQYFRRGFYRECEMCSSHTLVSAALDLYIDQVTGVSPITNRAVWITSDDKKLENSLTQFLDELAVEERLRDWASTLGMFGDFFIEAIAREGVGVAYVDDSMHPADFERIDINGRLEGFVRTGLFTNQGQQTADLEAPWKYVHFRTFGASRRTLNTALGIFGETGRTFSLERDRMADRQFRVTTKYGTSLLTPAIPIYKRLKMCEDSLIMARMTRGILWYLYKIKIAGGNPDSMAEIVANYAEYLKRSTGLNVDENSQEWKDKWSAMYAQIEDLFIPESDDVTVSVEKLGGEADIKAIVDIDMLQNQLLGAMRVSRTMLGITDELPGALGEGASRRISINFAKNAQRLQVGLRNGIKRLCQIHAAYRSLPCDPTRFEVNFAEINSAEEEELKDALDKGVDVAGKIADFLVAHIGENELDRMEMLSYINQKFLKLPDLNFNELVKKVQDKGKKKQYPQKPIPINSDLLAYLPGNRIFRITESMEVKSENKIWTPSKIIFTNGKK